MLTKRGLCRGDSEPLLTTKCTLNSFNVFRSLYIVYFTGVCLRVCAPKSVFLNITPTLASGFCALIDQKKLSLISRAKFFTVNSLLECVLHSKVT